jgi:DNA polymerase II large subunit
MHVLNNFIAIGTQLKVERPGKGAAFTPCDTIEGPIVKLKDGSVVSIDNEIKAREVKKDIVEVLFLGDVLINYGDFLNRNHVLVPPGYCEEWWIQELEKKTVSVFGALDYYKLADLVGSDYRFIEPLFKKPLKQKPSAQLAVNIAKATETPLHPSFTYFWNVIDKKKIPALVVWLSRMDLELREEELVKGILPIQKEQKRDLELLGIPHIVASNEFVVFKKEEALILNELFQFSSKDSDTLKKEFDLLVSDDKTKTALDVVNLFSPIKQRDKCGLFIGARMGRPEKAKMRKLTGSPHVLFPVGEEGGRLRSFQSALEAGKITADFSTHHCKKCNKEIFLGVCPFCGEKAARLFHCKTCGSIETSTCPKHGAATPFSRKELNIADYFTVLLDKLNTKTFPDLIKGVRGTSNREHVAEHLLKGILRAKHNVCVNKEGTTRYDCSELPITHFRPREIDVGVEKLRSLGYEKDIKGLPLKSSDQVLELFPQDILLPCCPDSPDEPADVVMIRTSNFIDDELESLYGLSPYYKVKKREGLVGQLVIGLAPHTSAGTLGRIVGFTKSQGFMAHPMMHAALRRDCDGDEACFVLLLDAFLNFSRKYLPDSRGSTMDAPLVLTSILAPTEVDDMVFDLDRVWSYPLEFYEACLDYKAPWEVKIQTLRSVLNTEQQYEGLGFTHDTDNINAGVLCSSYKTLPSMQDKLLCQMDLAQKIRAVDAEDVARLVIEKHFIRDIRGNLRKFSQQEFRCVACNAKFRRPPLLGNCSSCGGKIVFTVSEGSIVKYLEPSISLAEKYVLPNYLKQSLELVKRMIEGVFGKEKEKQLGLGAWFG